VQSPIVAEFHVFARPAPLPVRLQGHVSRKSSRRTESSPFRHPEAGRSLIGEQPRLREIEVAADLGRAADTIAPSGHGIYALVGSAEIDLSGPWNPDVPSSCLQP
jgi:hypothetical protein